MESTHAASFCFQKLDNFLFYYVDESGFSDFADKPAQNTPCVTFLAWFNEAQFSKPQIRAELSGHFSQATNAFHAHDDEGSEKSHWVPGWSSWTIDMEATAQSCFGKALVYVSEQGFYGLVFILSRQDSPPTHSGLNTQNTRPQFSK